MIAVAAAARFTVAFIFAVAGIFKLRPGAGFADTLAAFGVPKSVVRVLAIAIPTIELAIAAGQFWNTAAVLAAATGLTLLAVFSIAVALNLRSGNRLHCNCFGQFSAAPISGFTLVRNLVLATPAIVVIAVGIFNPEALTRGILGTLLTFEMLVGALLVTTAVGCWFVVWLLTESMRLQGQLLLRVEALEAGTPRRPVAAPGRPSVALAHVGLAIGTPAPTFSLPDLGGRLHELSDLIRNVRAAVLVFIDPNCGSCAALLPDIANWQRQNVSRLAVLPISQGSASPNRDHVSNFGLTRLLLQSGREVSAAFKSEANPSALVVAKNGTIASGLAVGADAIRALVAEWTSLVNLPRAGDVAPAIRLSDLSNAEVSLNSYIDDEMAIVFWDVQCGFCKRMLPELREWEHRASNVTTLIVSSGTVEANRALGLRSRILLDTGFAAGRAFGARGTPSAVLLDAQGRLRSDIAVGGPDVLALLGTIGTRQHSARSDTE